MAKLLLIEDEKILRENTSELLEVYGFECITASHGKEGIEMALKEKPDLIICDIMLPFFDGFEIKAFLNKQAGLALTPLIFLSARAERNDLRQGMDLGAADFITKPFKISELVNSIKSRLIQTKNVQAFLVEEGDDSTKDLLYRAKNECNIPLNAIINLSGLLSAEHINEPEFFNSALKAINTSGKRLSKTVNNMIDLVRLLHSREFADQEPPATDIKSIIERTVTERSRFYKYSGSIKTRFNDPEPVKVLQEDLEIMIFELIDNMFKFSSSGFVNVDLATKKSKDKKVMTLSVSNLLASPVIFTPNEISPLKQYNRTQTIQQGSGLGLFLIQTIVQKYLGSLEIDMAGFELFRIVLTIPLS